MNDQQIKQISRGFAKNNSQGASGGNNNYKNPYDAGDSIDLDRSNNL